MFMPYNISSEKDFERRRSHFSKLSKRVFLIAILFFLLFLTASAECARTAGGPAANDLAALIRVAAPLDFCGEPVPLQTPEARERLEREMLISLGNRPQVILWIKRSARYLPHIEKALKANNMPDDLKYVAIAESALMIHSRSVKGAMGVWQFMEGTGVRYLLKINADTDERLNFYAATRAALDYLRELYTLFGSWTLAAAAYNMGESGLRAEMLVQKVDDYYRLYLPLETQRYIFRILSVKLILSDPARYGFHLAAQDLYDPAPFEPIEIVCSQETPVQLVAQAAKTDFKAVKDLNPEIRGHYLPAGTHRLLFPPGGADGFQERFTTLFRQWLADRKAHVYVVEKGDSLSSIAERFNVPLQALMIWNRIPARKPIHPGDRLIVFPAPPRGAPEP
jgi:hypothetical protein